MGEHLKVLKDFYSGLSEEQKSLYDASNKRPGPPVGAFMVQKGQQAHVR